MMEKMEVGERDLDPGFQGGLRRRDLNSRGTWILDFPFHSLRWSSYLMSFQVGLRKRDCTSRKLTRTLAFPFHPPSWSSNPQLSGFQRRHRGED